MQAPYHHRPVSRPVVVSFIAMTGLLATPFFFAGLHMALFAAVAPVFAMTVEVSGRELSWHFGPGFWRKRIVLSDIAYVRHVRLPW